MNTSNNIHLFLSNAKARTNNVRIHYHTNIEISLILRGKGIYKINDSMIPIQEGDIFFFRPNEAHCITDIEQDGMELLNIHITPYYLYTNFQNALNSNYIKILAANFPLKSNKINDILSFECIQQIKQLIFSLQWEFKEKQSDYLTFACNHISAILILFSRPYKDLRISQKEKQNYPKLLSVIQYIDSNYKEIITLEQLAKKVSYSKCYFSSIFKKCMGMSIWDYISIRRIEEALKQIRNTDKNITDIALDCGFNNLANFNRIFKKYTNVTPNFFRIGTRS